MASVLATFNSDRIKPLWSAKVALAQTVSDLQTIADQIAGCAEKQEAKDGATQEKAAALSELADDAYEIATAVWRVQRAAGAYGSGGGSFTSSQ